MKNINVKCIILGHKNLHEYDKTVFLYTEEFGKIRVLAKGARKITSKFTGHLETLNFATAQIYFGPKNIILKEIVTLKNFKNLRENFTKLSAALKIAEITNKILYENQKIENLPNLLFLTLQQLVISKKPLLTVQSYILKILDRSGLIPDFKNLKTPLKQKYLKFLNFLKTRSFQDIQKINIDKVEENTIDKLFKNLIAYAT